MNTEKPRNAAEQLFGYIPEPKKRINPASHTNRRGIEVHESRGDHDMPSKGMLKIQAYVHNRITICSYQGGNRYVAKRMSLAKLQEWAKAAPNLDLWRETRRTLKIGGRWREKPLITDFTSRAKNWVRDGGELIEKVSGAKPLFLTLTWPGSLDDGFEAAGIASGYIVDRFNRWLREQVINGWFCYVWELQERGAPHLHYLFQLNYGADFKAFYRNTRTQWRKILLDAGNECGVDFFEDADGGTHRDNPNLPIINFKPVHEDTAGYIAKYASKEKTKGGSLSPFSPGRWWAVSYPLRHEVLKRRVSYVLGGTSVERMTELLIEAVDRIGKVTIETWRKTSDKVGPGEFVSITISEVVPADIANSLRAWFVDGDLAPLRRLMAAPYVAVPAPA